MLRQAISYYVVRLLGENLKAYHIYKESDRPINLIVNFDHLRECLIWVLVCDHQMAAFQNEINSPHLCLFYEDFQADVPGHLHKIQGWIGVPFSDRVDSMLKVVPENLRLIIANFDEMVEWLRNLTKSSGVAGFRVPFREEIDEIIRSGRI